MNYVFIYIIVILTIVYKCSSICTPVYGREPCPFSPAPPGHVPNCARPGVTFCEHPSYYPGQVIQYLLEKWKFDHSTLLMDETQDDFNTYYISSSDSKYSPNSIYGQPDSYFPEPIHIPKPDYPTYYPNKNTYIPPPPNSQNFTGYPPFQGYPDRRPSRPLPPFFEPYPSNIPYKQSKNPFSNPNIGYPPNSYKYFQQPHVQQFTPNYWKRQAQDERIDAHLRRKRSAKLTKLRKRLISIEDSYNGTSPVHSRRKRQNAGSAITGQQLCETTSQYIMPRAALNNKGDWKYVVNMPELDNRYTQLVKSETCASQVCNGICGLPNGYTSRCEQKYVQKRLIALETAGNQLYTDVFWFPSCCQCTITQN